MLTILSITVSGFTCRQDIPALLGQLITKSFIALLAAIHLVPPRRLTAALLGPSWGSPTDMGGEHSGVTMRRHLNLSCALELFAAFPFAFSCCKLGRLFVAQRLS